jgi:hypothetical protein
MRLKATNILREEGLVEMNPAEKGIYTLFSKSLADGKDMTAEELHDAGFNADDVKGLAKTLTERVHPILYDLAMHHEHVGKRGAKTTRKYDPHRVRVIRKMHDSMLPMLSLAEMDMRELEHKRH